jgi:glycosyltransferase involved in cell wall biosynthesis
MNRPLRVLHVITSLNRGGAENHLVALATIQAKAGCQVCIAYLKGDGYWSDQLISAGCNVIPLSLHRYGDVKPLILLCKQIRYFCPDIVHAHMPPAEVYSSLSLLLSRTSCALVTSKHNDEPFYPGWGHRLLGRIFLRRASRVIAISGAVAKYVKANLCPRLNQTVVIHYAINPLPYQAILPIQIDQIRREWRIPNGAQVIGVIARLVPQKSLDILLKAYACFRVNASYDTRLVIVGRGPLEADLRRLADALGLRTFVVWAGFREDIHAVMSVFDYFALTSSYEGFGLVLLEAMAAKRPIVATAVSAIPEVVLDGVTGILCPPGDIEALAAAFSRLSDPALRATLGEAGALRVQHEFSIDSMIEKTMSVYYECLGGPK